MHHFAYRNRVLHAEDVAIPGIAEAVGTPFYCYSTATLERHYRVFADAFAGTEALVCYAMKANSNQSVLATLAALGAGMDVVSGGELERARRAGVPGSRIVFSGVGKTAGEIAAALEAGVLSINVESEAELVLIDEVARARGLRAAVAIRVNPDVDAGTHAKITTGRAENKFGVALGDARRLYAEAARLKGVAVRGAAMHIGSQISDLGAFEAAFARLRALVEELRADGHAIDHVDLGGGLAIPYRPDDTPPGPQEYAAVVRRVFDRLGARLVLEPGRLIAGNAGILVTRVLYIKEGHDKTFVIVDAAMNDLVRPTLYDAYHEILTVEEAASGPSRACDVVGPVCESGDYLALARPLPPLQAGDLIALATAGAYGAVQAGTYNTRPLVAEVMVKGDRFAVVRPRQSLDELIGLDRLAPWLEEGRARPASRLATM